MRFIQTGGEQGLFAYVDDEDFDRLSKYRWGLRCHPKHGIRYATAKILGVNVTMHRFLMEVSDPAVKVDHVNGDGLDNRRENLRLATMSENCRNRRKQHRPSGCSSTYKGVSFNRGARAWSSTIRLHGKDFFLGLYDTEIEAAKAYDLAAVQYHGAFAKTNGLEGAVHITPIRRRRRPGKMRLKAALALPPA